MNIGRLLGIAAIVGVGLSSAKARDLTTYSGDVYKNIEVVKKDETGMQISHDDGVAFIDYKNLSEADQKVFGYDPAKYAIAWQQKLLARQQEKQQQMLVAQQAAARARAQAALTPEQSAQETWQPVQPSGLQVTYDTPGFGYGPYYFSGNTFDGSSFPYFSPSFRGTRFAPYPYAPYGGRGGNAWGTLDIRRR